MLNGVREGLFDAAAVRAILQGLSLFPIGSYVQLTDGRVGRVIRSNDAAYTSPVLEAWRREELHLPPEVVNLQESDLTIARPLASLESAE